MIRSYRIFPCLVLVSALVAQRLEGQRISDSLAAAIDSAPRVRVRLSTGWVVLEHPRLQHDSLSFVVGKGLDRGGSWIRVTPPVSLAAVQEIQMVAGNRAGKGAAWGGGIGLGLGLVMAIGAASGPPSYGTPTGSESAVVVLGLGATGALVGALIGRGTTHWVTVYPAPARSPSSRAASY